MCSVLFLSYSTRIKCKSAHNKQNVRNIEIILHHLRINHSFVLTYLSIFQYMCVWVVITNMFITNLIFFKLIF